jgi:hypothetical protein
MANERETAARLVPALLVKSLAELAFVCVLVAVAAFVNLHPLVRGAIDIADSSSVAGWAHDPRAPREAIEVQLFIDGRFVAGRRADQPRPDLVAADATDDPAHGFTFPLASFTLPPGPHHAQVYAVRPSFGRGLMLLPLAKSPLAFEVDKDAQNTRN